MGNLIWDRRPSLKYEGLVASRARMLNARDTTNRQAMSRYALFATEALTSVKVVLSNFNLDTGADTGVGAPNIGTASIEYPAGTFTALKAGGSTNLTTPDGGLLFCDYLPVSIPAGATFWLRNYVTNANGIMYFNLQNASIGEAATIGTSGVADQTLSGTVANSGGPVTIPPIAVIGLTSRASVVVVGDSIGYGANSNGDPNGSNNNYGNGLITPGLGAAIPFLNLSWPSLTAQGWVAKSTARRQIIPYASHMIQQLSTNDIINGRSQANLVSDLQAIYALARSGQKVLQTTGSPHASSTDVHSTDINQTPLEQAARATFNDSVRGGLAGTTGSIDIASVLETSRNADKWVFSPSPPYTADGLHCTQAGYDLVKNSGIIIGSIN